MKQRFQDAPFAVKIAVISILIYPIAISVYGFRLYAHPKNPDAWLVIAMLEVAYLLPALGVLFGCNLARWFCLVWVTLSIASGAFRLGTLSERPPLLAFVILCWIIQAGVVSLLFVPSSRRHFQKKEPIQAAETTRGK